MGEFIKWLISLAGTPLAGMATDFLQNQEFDKENEQNRQDALARFDTSVMELDELRDRIMGTGSTGGTQGGFSVAGQPATGGVNTASIQTRTGGGDWTQKYPTAPPSYGTIPGISAEQRGAWSNYAAGVGPAWDAMATPIEGGYAERAAQGAATSEEILSQANTDYDTAMLMVEGAGTQQRRDINEAYRVAGAGEQARLNELGLGGTTIAPTMAMGYERERLGAQGRLEDALLQQRLGVHGGYGAGRLNAMIGQQAFNAGLTGEQLAAQTNLGVGGFGATNEAQRANLGAQGQWAMVPPTYDMGLTQQFIDLYGNVNAPPPYQPSPVDYGSY